MPTQPVPQGAHAMQARSTTARSVAHGSRAGCGTTGDGAGCLPWRGNRGATQPAPSNNISSAGVRNIYQHGLLNKKYRRLQHRRHQQRQRRPPIAVVIAPRKEAHNQRQPLQQKSKNALFAFNTATHCTRRRPLHETLCVTISNTLVKASSSGPNSHSRRPVWGAHSGPYKPSTAWRIPDMLPNGTHSIR
jgi:hypothetical protein